MVDNACVINNGFQAPTIEQHRVVENEDAPRMRGGGEQRRDDIVVGCGMSGVCLVIGESIDDDDDDSQLIRLNQQKQ
ncbi:hypothetical protein T01_3348 [Trichinella spiralis]|uniref:Uncharacterized protein n=1 Tax=Trichinella spiralis TaxID=6334 RepID=A0A0V1BFY8_TRISP|nr:hypothetical protein T01_3348 [Trichinella spiralis]